MERFFKKKKDLKKKYFHNLNYKSLSSNEDEKKENKKYEKMNKLSSQLNKLKTFRSYNFNFEKQELNDIFNRANYLKKLEQHYYKEKDKYLINRRLFYNIHFNFKKELLSSNNNKNEHKILRKTKSMKSILPYLIKKENVLKKSSRSYRQRPNNYIKTFLRNSNSNSYFTTKSQDTTNLFVSNSKNSIMNKSNNKVFDNSQFLKPE
jgi:hypothetical protein